MRIPKSITLRGRRWRVVRPKTCSTGGDVLGCCSVAARTIEIRRDLTGGLALETYLHECLHAVFPRYIVSDRVQEALIENVDQGLADAVFPLLQGGR